MKPCNLVLITADQMRGDCIGWLGHPDVLTPNLDSFCNHGVAFTKAYSATPTCIPARVALFTGMSQQHHRRVGYQDFVPWNYPSTLPGELAAAGYHTHCAGKMHVWPPRALMGFHSVDLHDSFLPHRNTGTAAGSWWHCVDDYARFLRQEAHGADIGDFGLGANSRAAAPWPLEERLHPTNWTAERSLDFLRKRDPTKPFFLWTSFVAPHPPYYPPAHWLQYYQSQPLSPPATGQWSEKIGNPHPDPDSFEGQLSPQETQLMQAGYYGMISHMDAQIGRLIRSLRDCGELENTVILFTSDHGEMLGDHNMFRKHQAFEGSTHIPLILYDPGNRLNLAQGSRCDAVVELRDVMPTLLDLAGANCPSTVDGASLLQLLSGGQEPRAFLHGEHTSQQNSGESIQYIVTPRYKYIWLSRSGSEMLFDLQNDPRETCNLAAHPANTEVLAQLRQHLITALQTREEGYSDGKRLITKQPARLLLSHQDGEKGME